MQKTPKGGIFLAILAAALYAINSPFSKRLLDYMPPTLMAGFLYLGASLCKSTCFIKNNNVYLSKRFKLLCRA